MIRSGERITLSKPGVDEAAGPPYVVETGEVGALVNRISRLPIAATRENLAAHADVLADVVARATVLPMRFGVVMPSEEVVREELLGARHDELAALLARLDGYVELSVRAFYEGDVVLREVVAEDRTIAKLRDATRGLPEAATYYDRIRLGQLTAEAVERKRAGDERAIVDRLGPLAADARIDANLPERMVTNAAFLVERGRVREFDQAAAELAERFAGRVRFTYVGPLAPHSFVDLSQAAAGQPA